MKHYNVYIKFKGDNTLRHVSKVFNSTTAVKIANKFIKTGHVNEVEVEEVESNTIYRKEGK